MGLRVLTSFEGSRELLLHCRMVSVLLLAVHFLQSALTPGKFLNRVVMVYNY